jgi:hypothetical protein
MSAPSETGIYIFTICLLAPVLTYALVKYVWNQPLRNGPGYFLGIEVQAGFYQGPGKNWLTGYHAMLTALYGVWAVALAAIIVTRRWEMTPMWAGGFALLFVPSMLGYGMWTRHKLGVRPPVRSVALALESRRLGDYISWPAEALIVAVVGASWGMLLSGHRALVDWRSPLTLSWMILGLLPGKIAMVRAGSPLPAERAEEHYRYQDAERRNWLKLWGATAWFLAAVQFGAALIRAVSSGKSAPGMVWLALGADLAVWGYVMFVMFRGMRQMKAMSRDLRPAGSWRTPFGRASWMGTSRVFRIWFAVWFGGIMLLAFYPHR